MIPYETKLSVPCGTSETLVLVRSPGPQRASGTLGDPLGIPIKDPPSRVYQEPYWGLALPRFTQVGPCLGILCALDLSGGLGGPPKGAQEALIGGPPTAYRPLLKALYAPEIIMSLRDTVGPMNSPWPEDPYVVF